MDRKNNKNLSNFVVLATGMLIFMAAFDYLPFGVLAIFAIILIIGSWIFVIKGFSSFISDLRPKDRNRNGISDDGK